MSIASELNELTGKVERLTDARSAIAASIRGKGVTVPTLSGFEDFPSLIDAIEQSGPPVPPEPMDVMLWRKAVTVESARTSTTVLATKDELYAAGVISTRAGRITDDWAEYHIDFRLEDGSAYSTNQMIRAEAYNGVQINGEGGRRCRDTIYHLTSDSTVTSYGSSYDIDTSTVGFLSYTSDGLAFIPSTNNRLTANGYILTFVGIARR